MIERGVPAAPPPSEIGDDGVPVALWHDGDVAAVLVISRDEHADKECSGWGQDIEMYSRRDGNWELDSSAGSCWPVAYSDRHEGIVPKRTGIASGCPGAGAIRWLVPCIAPEGVSEVRVHAGGRPQLLTVEPTSGAFLVEADEPSPDLQFEVR